MTVTQNIIIALLASLLFLLALAALKRAEREARRQLATIDRDVLNDGSIDDDEWSNAVTVTSALERRD